MKNKYQKPAIYLTPEHTEGIRNRNLYGSMGQMGRWRKRSGCRELE